MNGGSIEKFLHKKYVNKLTKIKVLPEKMYFQSELESNRSNPQKTWELLNTILPSNKKKTQSPTSLFDQSNIQDNLTIITNTFNFFFDSNGENLASNCNGCNYTEFTTYLKNSVAILHH